MSITPSVELRELSVFAFFFFLFDTGAKLLLQYVI
jgi:hypothetical protein